MARAFMSDIKELVPTLRRMQGHGGLDLVIPHLRLNGPIPAISTKIPGTAYDQEASSGPINVIQDLANGELIFEEAGFWNVSWGLVCEVDGFTANDTAEVAIDPYNETLGAPAEVAMVSTVPRYGTYFSLAFSGNFEITESGLGNRLSLHWAQISGPTLTVVETLLLHFTASYAGKPGWPNV